MSVIENNLKETSSVTSLNSGLTPSNDLISRIDITELTSSPSEQSLSTSAVLSACKQKILRPYLRLLSVIGLRSFGFDGPNTSKFICFLNYGHLIIVFIFIISGYVLQYMACFRRDQGFSCSESYNLKNITFGFVLPSILHFLGCAYALYLFRFKESEQFERLMERTFLLSAHRANGRKTSFVKRLWVFIYVSIGWVVTSFCSILLLLVFNNNNNVSFKWINSNVFNVGLDVLFVLTTLWQDIVQAALITSYCMQVLLLTTSLCILREKLLQHTIDPLSWIREINECQNVLNYLNHDFSPAVCIFIFLNISWIISWVISFLKTENLGDDVSILAIMSLWSISALAPFILAANLNATCIKLRHLGHEVRIRPFVYQDTPGEELDTILLYTATLRLKSKLFAIPISGPYLYTCFTLLAMSVLVAGQSSLL